LVDCLQGTYLMMRVGLQQRNRPLELPTHLRRNHVWRQPELDVKVMDGSMLTGNFGRVILSGFVGSRSRFSRRSRLSRSGFF
jgi:hypothetical protein